MDTGQIWDSTCPIWAMSLSYTLDCCLLRFTVKDLLIKYQLARTYTKYFIRYSHIRKLFSTYSILYICLIFSFFSM